MKYAVLLLCLSLALQGRSQPALVAKYYGGHAEFESELRLYADSTFVFEESSGLVIPIHSKSVGYYVIKDSTITMLRRKRLYFLFFRKVHRYKQNNYRMRDDAILMYPEEMERRKDADFIQAYNTLRRVY